MRQNYTTIQMQSTMRKKVLLLLFCCLTALCGFAQTSGNCGKDGDNVKWNFDIATKTLTISGKGEMQDFSVPAPWRIYVITHVKIEDGVTSIGCEAFRECIRLASIDIPNSITNIEASAFYICTDLTSVTIPDGIKEIKEGTFADCAKLTSVIIPNGVTNIGAKAFAHTGLTSINIPNNVETIGYSAFSGCSNLTSVTLPNNLKIIRDQAFSYCRGLTSIDIPDSVETIEYNAFCSAGLISVTIGKNVKSIWDYAFRECYYLTSIICRASNPPAIYTNVFYAVNKSNCTLYVPVGNKELYGATWWGEFDFRDIEEEDIQIQAKGNLANFSWMTVKDAANYKITVYNDARRTKEKASVDVNANGNVLRAAGFLSCTISDLNKETTYYYSLTPYNAANKMLAIFNGEFKTTDEIKIDDATPTVAVSVYPNPASEYVYITEVEDGTPITLWDMSGKIVLQSIISSDEPVSVSHLPQGTYILQVAGTTMKIIKN